MSLIVVPSKFERLVLKRQLGYARPTHDHEAGVKFDGKRKSVQDLAQEPHNATWKQYITPSAAAQRIKTPPLHLLDYISTCYDVRPSHLLCLCSCVHHCRRLCEPRT